MATTDCRHVGTLLRDDLLDTLPPGEAARARDHLAGCADCQRAAREYRGAEAALRAHYGRIPGPALTPAQRARFVAPLAAPSRLGPIVTAGALIALCVAVIALAAILLRGGAPAVGPGGPASATPGATSGVALPAVVCPLPVSTASAPAAPPTPTQNAPGATMTAILAASQRPQVREDPCTMPASGLLTLDQAAAALRAFLGEPATAFTGGYVRVSGGFGPQPIGYLVSLRRLGANGAIVDDDLFNVDARSGEVSAANFRTQERLGAPTPTPVGGTPLSVEEARERATAYAAAHQSAFPQLAPRQMRGMIGPDGGEFVWQARDATSGAWLPSYLRITVSRSTGEVLGYSWLTTAYGGPTVPMITAEEALARAEAIARDDPRRAGATLDPPALEGHAAYTLNAAQGTPRLVWSFAYGSGPFTAFYIDALTGEVIERGPSG